MGTKGTTYTKHLLIAPCNCELTSFYWHFELQMNFDNQIIVSGTFLKQRWVLLLVYREVYFTEKGYTTPSQKYWNYAEISCFAAKTNRKIIHQFLLKNYDFLLWGFEVSSVLLFSYNFC